MPVIAVNTGKFAVKGHAFTPRALRPQMHGGAAPVRRNPREKVGAPLAGLITVGLTAQDESATYDVKDVVEIVKGVRIDQVGDPGASFMSQRGLYKHRVSGTVVEEESVRIILMNLNDAETADAFHEHVLDLADALLKELNQESVIVEFQNKGVTEETFIVTGS